MKGKGKTPSAPEEAQAAEAWARIAPVLAPIMRELSELRREGMPDEVGKLVDDLGAWALAAWLLPKLRLLMEPSGALSVLSDFGAAVEKHIHDCEEILGRGWSPDPHADITRDPRFGDFVVAIYSAILPRAKTTPQRRTPVRRGSPVAYSIEAARMTARIVNLRCARALGRRLTAEDVKTRVQKRRHSG